MKLAQKLPSFAPLAYPGILIITLAVSSMVVRHRFAGLEAAGSWKSRERSPAGALMNTWCRSRLQSFTDGERRKSLYGHITRIIAEIDRAPYWSYRRPAFLANHKGSGSATMNLRRDEVRD